MTHTLSIVKQLLQSAVDNRLIPMNPGIGISISQHEAITFNPITEDESKVLSKEEVDAFLNGAKNTRYYELPPIVGESMERFKQRVKIKNEQLRLLK